MDLGLAGKKALVCGSSQGIGKAVAYELASLGASVTLVARNEAKLQAALKELPHVHNNQHDYLCMDFTEPEKVQQKIADYLKKNPEIHILLNNSGGPKPGTILTAVPKEFQEAFSQHLLMNHILAQALIPGMKKVGYGRIVNIVSISVKEPIPGLGVSNTIRAAVASWAKTLATELAPFGITVNNVLPGYTNTERLRSLIAEKAKQANKTEAEMADQMRSLIPARRFAESSETAAAVAFLASPAASYITGVNLPVDGGRLGCL